MNASQYLQGIKFDVFIKEAFFLIEKPLVFRGRMVIMEAGQTPLLLKSLPTVSRMPVGPRCHQCRRWHLQGSIGRFFHWFLFLWRCFWCCFGSTCGTFFQKSYRNDAEINPCKNYSPGLAPPTVLREQVHWFSTSKIQTGQLSIFFAAFCPIETNPKQSRVRPAWTGYFVLLQGLLIFVTMFCLRCHTNVLERLNFTSMYEKRMLFLFRQR